jgi:hypothetical protein
MATRDSAEAKNKGPNSGNDSRNYVLMCHIPLFIFQHRDTVTAYAPWTDLIASHGHLYALIWAQKRNSGVSSVGDLGVHVRFYDTGIFDPLLFLCMLCRRFWAMDLPCGNFEPDQTFSGATKLRQFSTQRIYHDRTDARDWTYTRTQSYRQQSARGRKSNVCLNLRYRTFLLQVLKFLSFTQGASSADLLRITPQISIDGSNIPIGFFVLHMYRSN